MEQTDFPAPPEPAPVPTESTSPPAIKPGYKTTEFWLALLFGLLGAFIASGIVPDTHPAVKIAGIALSALSALGYTYPRSNVKVAFHTGVKFLLVGLLGTGLTSCATLKSTGVIDCLKDVAQTEVDDISPTVGVILSGGQVDWQVKLDALKARSLGALACAVAKVGVALATGQGHALMASAAVTPSDRAAFYLLSRDLHPTNVQK